MMQAAISYQRLAVSFGWRIGCAAVLLFASAACGPPSDERQVKNAVGAFYDVYMKIRPSGVPTKEQQVDFKNVLSTGLAALLDVAAGVEENASRETGGEAAPRLEGDLFTSADEGAGSYKILECEIRKPAATCVVELTNVDDRKRSKLAWKDRVFLVRQADRWVVDDIEYFGEEEYMHQGRLKDVLKQIIGEGKSLPAVSFLRFAAPRAAG
jgi:hypothetical protein